MPRPARSRPALKVTTALTLTLSLLQPGLAPAQGMALRHGLSLPMGDEGAPERLWQVQDCVADPTQEGCPVPEGTAAEEEAPPAEAPPEPEPEVAPAEPEVAPAAPEPEAVVPAPEVAPVEPEAAVPVPEAVVPEAETAPVEQEAVVPEPEAAPAEPEAAVPEPEAAPAETEAILPEPETAPAEQAIVPEPEAAPVEPEASAPEPAPDLLETVPAEPEAVAPEPEAVAPEPAAVVPEPAAVVPEPEAAPPEPEVALPPIDVAPEPTPAEVVVIEEMLGDPEVAAAVDTLAQTQAPADPATAAPVAGVAAVAAAASGASPDPATAVTQTIGGDQARQASQDFATSLSTAVPAAAPARKDGLSDLEKAGLIALGAVAVGMLIGNNRVVASSGDRVVVDRGNGDLAVWKDDNANLRAAGVVETTERFVDGSTLTTLERPDGSQIVTVRDATGRVLRRDRVNLNGSRVTLIDDTWARDPVVVSSLPRPRASALRLPANADPALVLALLDRAEQRDIGRTFSLEQVRAIAEVRDLAPELSGGVITFASGSAALRPEDAGSLVDLAGIMNTLIDRDPSELFLIEGHTDAVGSAAFNLALSDRRAETVALALTEYFGVPAENLVVQGYGERFLKVPVATSEPANRRVAARRITWLVEG